MGCMCFLFRFLFPALLQEASCIGVASQVRGCAWVWGAAPAFDAYMFCEKCCGCALEDPGNDLDQGNG